MKQRDFDLVIAVDSKGGIGKDNDLPWDLPGDMAHFVSQTKTAPKGRRNAVVMGRNNWESIPDRYRPFSGRLNVVMTRNESYALPDGVVRAPSFDVALSMLPANIDRVYVIGGGKIFEQALELPACRRIYLTRIDHDFDCDVFVPISFPRFERVNVFEEGVDGGIDYRIELWERYEAPPQ